MMPITYTFDAEQRLLRTSVTGPVGVAEIEAYFRRVSEEPWFPVPSLTDVRGAAPDMESSEIRRIVGDLRLMAPQLGASTPTAVVVGSDVAYGLVRMIGLLVEDVAVIMPFRDPAAAGNWLTAQRPLERQPQV